MGLAPNEAQEHSFVSLTEVYGSAGQFLNRAQEKSQLTAGPPLTGVRWLADQLPMGTQGENLLTAEPPVTEAHWSHWGNMKQ